MKFSESWLRGFVSPEPELDTQQLADRLTMLGLEVDSIESAGQVDERVIVAEVVSMNALKPGSSLVSCDLEVGRGKPRPSVVCGAPNVRVGMKAVLAQVGAEITPGRVETREIHGKLSEGMLVSELEIGLSETSDTIMELDEQLPVGESLQQALNLDDACIGLDLTPDRGDCQGVLGIARDLAASLGATLVLPPLKEPKVDIEDRFPVRVDAPKACASFLAAICRGIEKGRASPMWLRERLRRSGVRCIHPAVDITNYVMLELGRPLHAFDLDKVKGGILVRFGRRDEGLALLDGREIALDEEILAICDHGGPMALAGIMGDAASGVTSDTTDVLFECAWFNPLSLGRTARRLGIQTDASIRFERGVDPAMMKFGMDRARQLLADITGAKLGPVTRAVSEQDLPKRSRLALRRSQVKRLIGQDIDPSFIEDSLSRLGFEMTQETPETWMATVPSHRFDIEGEADLVEEVARLHGFEQVPEVPFEGIRSVPRLVRESRSLREFLAAQGYREIISYSFLPESLVEPLTGTDSTVSLVNPMSSDQAVMRNSLIPGLLRCVSSNMSRQHPRARLFELGRVFLARDADLESQPLRIAGVHCGSLWPESWNQSKRAVDFFDMKGDVERLLGVCGVAADASWRRSSDPLCHPGRGATLVLGKREAGLIGELHPDRARAAEINEQVCFFELDVGVISRREPSTFVEPSRFPRARRDLAVVVKRDLAVAEIEQAIRNTSDELLCELGVFDVYEGDGIQESDKSVAIRLIFQTRGRTLKDEEISQRVDLIVDALRVQFDASLRGV